MRVDRETHYHKLMVAEHATPDVIRAAYRTLAKRWHPDRHPDDQERAHKRMQVINNAYAVLSDQKKRREHDLWIAQAREAERIEDEIQASAPEPERPPSSPEQPQWAHQQPPAESPMRRQIMVGLLMLSMPVSTMALVVIVARLVMDPAASISTPLFVLVTALTVGWTARADLRASG